MNINKMHYTTTRIKPMEYKLGESPRHAFIKNYMSHIDGFCNYNPDKSWNVLQQGGMREKGEFPNCKKCLKVYLTKVEFKKEDGCIAIVSYKDKMIKIEVPNNMNLNNEFKEIKLAESYLKEHGFVEYKK